MKDGGKRKQRPKDEDRTYVEVPVQLTVIACPVCAAEIPAWAHEDECRCGRCGFRVVTRSERDH